MPNFREFFAALLYFAVLRVFQSLVENGTAAWWALWLPNGALLLLSLWYWRKIWRAA